MSRNVLLIGGGGVVVLGLLVGLWLLLMRGEDASARDTTTSTNTPVTTTGSGSATRSPQGGVSTGTSSVPRAPDNGVPVAASGENPREYTIGDMHVTDHRTGPQKPLDVPPNVHPEEGHHIQSSTTFAITQKVKEVLYKCAASIPKDARGEERPRLEGQIVISVKNKQVSVVGATMQLRNLRDDAAATAKQCVESKSIGLEASGPGESDIDAYTINISMAVP